MPSYCDVRLLGHAGRDAEMITTSGGKQVTKWTMATGSKEYTQWHNCQAWGKAAEIAAEIKKGDLVEIVGDIRYREYEGKRFTDINAFLVYRMGGRKGTGQGAPSTAPPKAMAEAKPVEDDSELPF